MVFALGFLVSGLLTLLFLPAFWRRAARLSTHRLEMRMPLSMNEIVAERDQLRAVYATEQRRLEQQAESLQEIRARDMGELGRRATALTHLGGELAQVESELARVRNDLRASDNELVSARAEIGSLHQAHWDVSGRAENRAQALAQLETEHLALNGLADEGRVAAAGLETRAASLEMQIEDLLRRLESAAREATEKTLALDKLAEERDFLQVEGASAAARRDQLQASAVEQNQRVAELERAHRLERRARARLENDLASGAKALEESIAERRAAEDGIARQLQDVGERERKLHQQIEDLRAEKAALEGALGAARRESAKLRGERAVESTSALVDPAVGVSAEDAAALRQSISDIGAEVSRLVRRLQEEKAETTAGEGGPTAQPGERVRELQARVKRAVPSH